jgi:hypothetical protein
MEIPKMKSNYGSGPRLGNESARADKREIFKEGKTERSNLADSINKAFTARTMPPSVDPRLESVASDVKPKKFKR